MHKVEAKQQTEVLANEMWRVPVPGEAKLYLAGPDLISVTRSLTVWTASDGWTVSTVGEVTAIVTGSKSL